MLFESITDKEEKLIEKSWGPLSAIISLVDTTKTYHGGYVWIIGNQLKENRCVSDSEDGKQHGFFGGL